MSLNSGENNENVDKLFDSSDDEVDAPALEIPSQVDAESDEKYAEGGVSKKADQQPYVDDEGGAPLHSSQAPLSRIGSDEEGGEEGGEESDDRSPSPQIELGPPLELQAALQDGPPSERLRLVKASNLLGVDTQPWAPSTHVYEAEHVEDPLTGAIRVQLNQRVRWRFGEADDGCVTRESNARFVRWSDGSLQLLVGEEVLDVTEADVDNHYMYLRHSGFIQAQAHLAKRMAFRPSSITSAAHRRLKQAVKKQHTGKGRTTKITTTIADPVKEKHAQAKLEEQKIRGREGLARKQDRMMGRYQRPAPRFTSTYGSSALSARFLEEGDDDDLDNGDDDGLMRPHQGLREEEAERRLANAKRSPPPPVGPSAKRQRPGHELDSDEDDGDGSDKSPGVAAPHRRQRAIALSDDDEDGDM